MMDIPIRFRDGKFLYKEDNSEVKGLYYKKKYWEQLGIAQADGDDYNENDDLEEPDQDDHNDEKLDEDDSEDGDESEDPTQKTDEKKPTTQRLIP